MAVPQALAGLEPFVAWHIFRFEATRVDNRPDIEALSAAVAAATRATELDATMGEGWAALGHALANLGRVEHSRAALRQALALEPRNWRHRYRLAVCTWGEERLPVTLVPSRVDFLPPHQLLCSA
ncbi:MAG: tetratricopeptide repeat protein [Acidobacteriota bacterium]